MAEETRKAVHVEEEAKMAPEKVNNASRERGKGVWNRQGQVTLRVANPVVVSTKLLLLCMLSSVSAALHLRRPHASVGRSSVPVERKRSRAS